MKGCGVPIRIEQKIKGKKGFAISEKDFVKIINLLEKQEKFENNLGDALEEASSSLNYSSFQFDKYTRKALDILLGMLFTGEELDTIDEFLYDYNCSQITYCFKTAKELYSYLLERRNK